MQFFKFFLPILCLNLMERALLIDFHQFSFSFWLQTYLIFTNLL